VGAQVSFDLFILLGKASLVFDTGKPDDGLSSLDLHWFRAKSSACLLLALPNDTMHIE
jgi:hypothetical protein